MKHESRIMTGRQGKATSSVNLLLQVSGFRNWVRGFTLIEVVVYIALFTTVAMLTTQFFVGILRASIAVKAEESAIANAALTFKFLEFEIRQADAVYTSTSVFDNNAGQLSLRTPRLTPTDHPFAYVDFYIDNGILYQRRDDGTTPVAITSADVQVTVFRMERKTSGSIEGIRLTITTLPQNLDSRLAEAKTLHAFVVPRSFSP